MSCRGRTPSGGKRGGTITATRGTPGKGKVLRKNQRVADMAVEVLTRQAETRAQQIGETFEEAFKAVLQTEAGRQLEELRNGPHRDEGADEWQHGLPRNRAQERRTARQEERSRSRQEDLRRAQLAAWESFVQTELRELGLRKDGQLGRLLGEALPGELPTALQRLAYEDRRQAETGLVALMSNGEVYYKNIEELCEEDMPARIAAKKVRTTWLKERHDGWLGPRED